jgi:hypothetical protein
MPTRRLTRAELHTLIWSQSPEAVAAELGVPRALLDQMLKTMAVPYPWSGYWSSPASAAGRIPKLTRARPETPEAFEFEFEPAQEPEPGAPPPGFSRPGHRKGDGITEPSVGSAPTAVPDLQLAQPEAATRIPRLINPHRIIAARIAEEKRRRLEYQELGWGIGRQSLTPMERRIRLVEDRLFKLIERRGHKVSIERGSLHQVHFIIRGQRITYAIRERYRIQREPLSDSEKQERWNLEADRTEKRVRVMTGVLSLKFGEWGWNHKPFQDMPGRPLEDQVEDITNEAEALASAANAAAERRRIESIEAYEKFKRQEVLRKQAEENAKRWSYLQRLSDQAFEAHRMRRFLRVLEARLSQDPNDLEGAEFLAWAYRQLDEIDPLTWRPGAIVREVQAAALRDNSSQ